MKSTIFIAAAALSTLSVIYLVRLSNEAESFSNGEAPPIQSANTTLASNEEQFGFIPESVIPNDTFYKKKKSHFNVYANQPNTVYGKEGTRLDFPANSFVDVDGNIVKGRVRISMEECYEVMDMLQAKLSTTSDGKLLETAGMIRLSATADGKEVQIGKNAAFRISFPKNGSSKEGFKLFYGERNNDGIMNWSLAENDGFGPIRLDRIEGEPTDLPESDAPTQPYVSRLTEGQSCFINICDSYLRRDLKINKMDYFNWQLTDGQMLNQWFVSNFNPTLKMLDDFCIDGLRCEVTFKLNEDGTFQSYYISKSSTEEYDDVIVDFLKSMPALDLEKLMPNYTYEHSCILTFGSKVGRKQESFASDFRKKFVQDPDSTLRNVEASILDYYVLTSSQLGWINCDRFYDSAGPTTDYIVMNDGSENCTVSMVFDDMASVLKGVHEGNKTIFKEVPQGKSVRLIAIDNRGGTPVMAIARGNTSEKKKEMKNYKPFTLGELDAQFARLN